MCAPLFGSEADRVSNFTLATPVRPSFAEATVTKSPLAFLESDPFILKHILRS
jgi:hypothetical protein